MDKEKMTTDLDLMNKIVRRASEELHISGITVAMDLDYCLEYQSLDLERLYHFQAFDFAHDILGINSHLDHATHRLDHGFLPRCAN